MALLVLCPEETLVNNILRKIVALCLIVTTFVTGPTVAFSQSSTNLCTNQGLVLVFFNGVLTPYEDALLGSAELRKIHGETTPSGEALRYDTMYNYTAGFEDFVETFEQRLKEQEGLLDGKFELFFEALSGDGPWWRKIIDTVSSTANILTSFVDWYKANAIAKLTSMYTTPPYASKLRRAQV
jgi:hypothetical protein